MSRKTGTLLVKPQSANLELNSEALEKTDVYCQVIVGSNSLDTRVAHGQHHNPQWEDVLAYRVNGEAACQIRVFEKDNLTKNDHLGDLSVALADTYLRKMIRDTYEIKKDKRNIGQMVVAFEFFPEILEWGSGEDGKLSTHLADAQSNEKARGQREGLVHQNEPREQNTTAGSVVASQDRSSTVQPAGQSLNTYMNGHTPSQTGSSHQGLTKTEGPLQQLNSQQGFNQRTDLPAGPTTHVERPRTYQSESNIGQSSNQHSSGPIHQGLTGPIGSLTNDAQPRTYPELKTQGPFAQASSPGAQVPSYPQGQPASGELLGRLAHGINLQTNHQIQSANNSSQQFRPGVQTGTFSSGQYAPGMQSTTAQWNQAPREGLQPHQGQPSNQTNQFIMNSSQPTELRQPGIQSISGSANAQAQGSQSQTSTPGLTTQYGNSSSFNPQTQIYRPGQYPTFSSQTVSGGSQGASTGSYSQSAVPQKSPGLSPQPTSVTGQGISSSPQYAYSSPGQISGGTSSLPQGYSRPASNTQGFAPSYAQTAGSNPLPTASYTSNAQPQGIPAHQGLSGAPYQTWTQTPTYTTYSTTSTTNQVIRK